MGMPPIYNPQNPLWVAVEYVSSQAMNAGTVHREKPEPVCGSRIQACSAFATPRALDTDLHSNKPESAGINRHGDHDALRNRPRDCIDRNCEPLSAMMSLFNQSVTKQLLGVSAVLRSKIH